jgi:3-dehydroquinate synthase
LNFGHTVGHALEAEAEFKGYHGEAVAVGIIAAAKISQRLGLLKANDVEGIKKMIAKFGLPIACAGVSADNLIETIRFDKKTTSGQTRWVLVEGIGKGITNQTVPEEVVAKILEELC